MNLYGIFFTRGSQIVRLPVNPSKMPIAREADVKTYNVIALGEIAVPRLPNLRTVEIQSFFPGRPFPGVLTSGGFRDPSFYLDFFRGVMESSEPIIYTVTRYLEDGTPYAEQEAGFPVVVQSFQIEERGGQTGDFWYTLRLLEYRDYQPRELTVDANGAENIAAIEEPTRETPTSQIVVGSVCTANGNYYADYYGDEENGVANGITVSVTRIVDKTRPYPIHVMQDRSWLGWMAESALRVVSNP